MTNQGTIYMVGTGPGPLSLMTVKGMALVREADAIVGDTLSHASLLQEANPEAELHNIGCRASKNKLSKQEITQLLIDLARQGKRVVRLWPGDPFIYGRAAEEMADIMKAGLPVELVPGLTSAIAAPAYAGVPVTHWEYASSFAVATGYQSKNPAVRPDWTALARMETLVILMPLDDLAEIVDRLLAAGRTSDTPALVVQQGTLPHQKQVAATLATLVEAVKTHQIEHPAIVVVGDVVKLADELAWFKVGSDYPLRGKRVLVTRPEHQAGDFMAALRALGADPIAFPTIEIRPVADTDPLDEAIKRIGEGAKGRISARQAEINNLATQAPVPALPYDWLVLTSANGVKAFWDRLDHLGLDSRCLAALRIAAIGPATATALHRRSIVPDLVPEVYTAEGVLDAFDALGPVTGQRFLLARADIARKTLAEGLVERGAQVDEIAAYRTVPIQNGSTPPAADVVTFTSSSTVRGYVNCLGGRSPAAALKDSQVICIGPITATTAQELQVPVSATAEEYTIKGLLATLTEVNDDNGSTTPTKQGP